MSASDKSVEALSGLLLSRAGHPLSCDRQYRIETALWPILRLRGIRNIDALVDAMTNQFDGGQLETAVVEALLNNETYFFRDRIPFELINRFLPERLAKVRPHRHIIFWSAGVCPGQEATPLTLIVRKR